MTSHRVQLYDLDAGLVQSVRELASEALLHRDAAVVIATGPHLQAIRELLTLDGVDVAAAEAGEQYVPLDAAETLARIVREGEVARDLFEDVVGGVIANASARYGEVAAFGEMVGLLLGDGAPEAALVLEALWNDLLARHPQVQLLCGYRSSEIRAASEAGFLEAMCATHTGEVPAGVSASGRSLEPLETMHVLVQSAPRQLQSLSFFIEVGKRFDLSPADVESSLQTLQTTGEARVDDLGRWGTGRRR